MTSLNKPQQGSTDNGSSPPAQRSDRFESEARTAVDGLRAALAELVADVRGDPNQPLELSRRFGLDKTLTWKIARVICNDDAFGAVVHVPGRPSIKALAEAFSRGGASAGAVGAVLEAMDRFEDVVKRHSGDRGTFEVMLGAGSDPLARKRGENSRKSLFQGASATWGVQARAQVSLDFVAPSAGDEEHLDLAGIAGFIGFRRLRPEVSWTVAVMSMCHDQGAPLSAPQIRPMDPARGPGDAPLLPRFCSTPLPELRKSLRRENTAAYELTEGPIGITAAADCITGWVVRGGVGRYRTPDDRLGGHALRLSTPVELLYHDLYVHRSLTFAMKPTIHLFSDLPGGPIFPFDGYERGQLPVTETVIDLGEGPPSASAADIPRYRGMVETAVGSLGRGLEEFHGYRFKMKFPPIPSQLVYWYELPERP